MLRHQAWLPWSCEAFSEFRQVKRGILMRLPLTECGVAMYASRRSKHFFLCVCSLLTVFLFVPVVMVGQAVSTGTIAGTGTDPPGGAVAGATVRVTDEPTSTSPTATTNETGAYVFANVVPGTYSLPINKTGFRVAQLRQLDVN